MDRYVSPPLTVPPPAKHSTYDHVDLELHGLDHSGESFAVRAFVNDTEATAQTPTEGNPAYAGSFYVFGHGPCLGDEGHCEVPPGPVSPYDFRDPHPLTPQYQSLPITDTLRARAGGESKFTVTLVPVANRGGKPEGADLLYFGRLGLIAYS
ncbi:MAG TPA: hypothetical protein VGG98_04135 [Solirubrobacteraceae bacterium]|jgi:hypothetical protein